MSHVDAYAATVGSTPNRLPDAIILGCVSSKRDGPAAAKDLYDSPLWDRRRRYAETSGLPWVIYSAKHGILAPDEVIESYDVALKRLPVGDRRRMGQVAILGLEGRFGPLHGKTFEIHAGSAYVDSLAMPLRDRGADLVNRLEGLGIGDQMHWYDVTAGGSPPPGRPEAPSRRSRRLPTSRGGRRTTTFELQFDPDLLRDLANRYDYGGDDRMAAIGGAARNRGRFTRAEFVEICFWKSPRSAPLIRSNPAAAVEEATASSLAAPDEQTRIESLLSLSGVSWPTASVLLHFAHRDPYPILDYRALAALGVRRTWFAMPFWLGYVAATRRLAAEYGVDMRTLDRALWEWSREHTA